MHSTIIYIPPQINASPYVQTTLISPLPSTLGGSSHFIFAVNTTYSQNGRINTSPRALSFTNLLTRSYWLLNVLNMKRKRNKKENT